MTTEKQELDIGLAIRLEKELFDNDDAVFEQWLDSSVEALEGKTPRELSGTGHGCQQLRLYLLSINYGDYS